MDKTLAYLQRISWKSRTKKKRLRPVIFNIGPPVSLSGFSNLRCLNFSDWYEHHCSCGCPPEFEVRYSKKAGCPLPEFFISFRNYLLSGILVPFCKQVIRYLVRQTELLNRNTRRDTFQFIAHKQTLKIIITIHKLCFWFNGSKVLPFMSFILYVIFGG